MMSPRERLAAIHEHRLRASEAVERAMDEACTSGTDLAFHMLKVAEGRYHALYRLEARVQHAVNASVEPAPPMRSEDVGE
jgi:hypothetical protein